MVEHLQTTMQSAVESYTNSSTSPLLSLPPEVRNMIYNMVLLSGMPFQPRGMLFIIPRNTPKDDLVAILLRTKYRITPEISCTNRQLRRETLPMFYAPYTLAIALDAQKPCEWLKGLTELEKRHMKKVEILYWSIPSGRGKEDLCWSDTYPVVTQSHKGDLKFSFGRVLWHQCVCKLKKQVEDAVKHSLEKAHDLTIGLSRAVHAAVVIEKLCLTHEKMEDWGYSERRERCGRLS